MRLVPHSAKPSRDREGAVDATFPTHSDGSGFRFADMQNRARQQAEHVRKLSPRRVRGAQRCNGRTPLVCDQRPAVGIAVLIHCRGRIEIGTVLDFVKRQTHPRRLTLPGARSDRLGRQQNQPARRAIEAHHNVMYAPQCVFGDEVLYHPGVAIGSLHGIADHFTQAFWSLERPARASEEELDAGRFSR